MLVALNVEGADRDVRPPTRSRRRELVDYEASLRDVFEMAAVRDVRAITCTVGTAGHKINLQHFTSQGLILPVRVRLNALVIDAKTLLTHVALAVDQRAVRVELARPHEPRHQQLLRSVIGRTEQVEFITAGMGILTGETDH
ncbi:hypothetical protein D9M70_534430 [compost metagenome]